MSLKCGVKAMTHLSIVQKTRLIPPASSTFRSSRQMAAEICQQCAGIFSGVNKTGWGKDSEGQNHHQTVAALFSAADNGCYICSTIARKFQDESLREKLDFSLQWHLWQPEGLPHGCLKLSMEQQRSLTSQISVFNIVPDWDAVEAEILEIAKELGPDEYLYIGKEDMWGFIVWPTEGNLLSDEGFSSADIV
jgi:hypothetical protein